MEELDDDVKVLIEQNPVFKVIKGGTKIQCSVTGHEMPCRADVLKQHMAGKKYQRQIKLHEFDYDQYKPHIVPSEKKWGKLRKQLFCKLTLRHLNCDPHHVTRHVSGKRYKTALAKWEECQQTGKPFYPRGGSRNLAKQSGVDDDTEETGEGDGTGPSNKKNERRSEDEEGVTEEWRGLEEMTCGDEDGEDDTDSLTDLYPADDFSVDEASVGEQENSQPAESGSDDEFEDDEDIPEVKPKQTQKGPQKRKTTGDAKNKETKKRKKTKQSDPKQISKPGIKQHGSKKNKQSNKKGKKKT